MGGAAMSGLIPDGIGLMPLLALGIMIAVALLGGVAVHLWLVFWRAWTRAWYAVAGRIYLKQPWGVAWDRACRRFS